MVDEMNECFDQQNVWVQCRNDGMVKTLNNSMLAMCREPYHQAIVENIDCVINLENRDPDVRRCVAQHREDMNSLTVTICNSTNQLFECARQPIVSKCGAEIYNIFVKITGSLISQSTECKFTVQPVVMKEEKTTQNPEFSKKPSPAVGELVSEVTTEKPKGAAANIAVSSILMLMISAIFVF